MSFVIGGIEIQMMADLARLKKDMDQAKSMVGDASKAMQGAADMVKTAFAAIGAGLTVAALVHVVKGAIDAAEALHDLSIRTGASVESLSALQAIGRTTGTSAEAIAGAMNKLAKNMAVANEDSKGTGQAIKALGLDFETFRRLSPDQQMLALATAMGKFEDGSGKSAAAMTLLGKEGAKMLPFMTDLAAAGQLVATTTSEQADMADKFNDTLQLGKLRTEAMTRALAMGLLPTMVDAQGMTQEFARLIGDYLDDGVTKSTGSLRTMTPVIRVLGVVMESLIVLAANVAFVFKGIGTEVGGLAAQAVAFVSGNFKQVGAIRAAMVSDAEAARAALDKFEKSILGVTDRTLQGIEATKKSTVSMADNGRELANMNAKARIAAKGQLDFKAAAGEASKAVKDQEAANKKATDAADKLAKEVEKLTDAGKDYLTHQRQANETTQREIDLGRSLSVVEVAELDLTRKLATGKLLMASGTETAARAQIKLAGELAITKQWLKETTAENAAAADAVDKKTAAVIAETEKQREANQAIGLTTAALGDLKVARLLEMAAAADKNAQWEEEYILVSGATSAQRALAQAYRDAAGAAQSGAHLTAAKETKESWQKVADSIGESMTDALFRAVESGKSLWRAFRDVLVNTFKTTVLRPIISAVMAPITGAIGSMFMSGGASAAGGAGGGLGSMAGSMLGLGSMGGLAGIFSSGATMAMNGGFGVAMQGAGSMMANGSMVQGAAQGAGAMAPYAAGAAVGVYGGRAISNGYSAIGSGSGNTAVNVGTAIGAIWGPLGMAIGGAIGGLVNRAFGTKMVDKGSGISGTISSGDFSGNKFADWQKKGGWFRSDSSGTNTSALDGDMLAALRTSSAAVAAQIKSYAQVLGLPTAAIANVSKQIRIQLTDDQAANEAAIGKVFAAYQDEIADVVTGSRLAIFKRLGETNTEALARLSGIQRMTDQLQEYGGVFSRIAALSVTAKDELIGFAGSIDALIAKAQSFVANYYTEGEQAGISARQIQAQLTALGLSGAQVSGMDSRADFRALVERADLSSSAGRKQFNDLLDIAQQFAGVGQYLEQNGGTLGSLARQAPRQAELYDSILNALNPDMSGSSWPAAVEAWTNGLGVLNTSTQGVGVQIKDSFDSLGNMLKGLFDDLREAVKSNGRIVSDAVHEAGAGNG